MPHPPLTSRASSAAGDRQGDEPRWEVPPGPPRDLGAEPCCQFLPRGLREPALKIRDPH
jgi:hypothetical protein